MVSLIEHKLPGEVLEDVAKRVVTKRKSLGITQTELAKRSGVSLGSIKRFESTHQIAFASLINIAFALSCEKDFEQLFAQQSYASIDDVINSSRKAR